MNNGKPRRTSLTLVHMKPTGEYPNGGYFYWINAKYRTGKERVRKTPTFGSQELAHEEALNVQEEVQEVEWIT